MLGLKKIGVLLSFLALLTITCGFVNSANANFIGAISYPYHKPNYNPPSIEIHAPLQNGTYELTPFIATSNLDLNFSLTKNSIGPVLSVWYTLDDSERFYFDVTDTDEPYNENWVLNFTTQLPVDCCVHSLKIGYEVKSYYITHVAGEGWIYPSVLVSGESEPVTFTVSSAEPTDYLLPISAIAVVIVFPVLFFRRRRKSVDMVP